MMRRRPVLRTAGRTAVIAGTATAVSGRVARRQQRRAMEDAVAYSPAPSAAPAPAAPPPAAPPPGGLSEESLARLTSLAELHEQGVLTDAEFAEQKAKILDA